MVSSTLAVALMVTLLPMIFARSLRSARSLHTHTESSPYVRRLLIGDCKTTYPTCNDGSPSGYYLQRPSEGSTTWVIYLEGGEFCTDGASCALRREEAPGHTSSNSWGLLKIPGTSSAQGVLSSDSTVNPHLHSATKVYVPYCSSDLWSGTSMNSTDGMIFSGALIFRAIVRDLIQREGLATASRIVFSGTSAGGIGVLLHIDNLREMLLAAGAPSNLHIQGLMDSAWYAHDPENCTATALEDVRRKHCLDDSIITQMREGYRLWRGAVPQTCSQADSKPWLCYISSILRPSVRSHIFVFQWLYDNYYIQNTRIPYLLKRGEVISSLDYSNAAQKIHSISTLIRRSMLEQKSLNTSHLTVMVLPTCFRHGGLLLDSWTAPMPKDTTLAEIVDCFYAHAIGMPESGMHDGRCGRRAYYKHNCRNPLLEESSCPRDRMSHVFEEIKRSIADIPQVVSHSYKTAECRAQ